MIKYLKNKKIFSIVSCVLFSVFIFLFYKQAVSTNDMFVSDLTLHLEFAKKGDSYSALYFLMGILLRAKNGLLAIAILEACFVIATWWLTVYYINSTIQEESILVKIVLEISFFTLLFLTSIYLPQIHPFFYRYSVITQPWHNITYLGMRLFSLITFFNFTKIFLHYKEKITLYNWLSIAGPLILATSVKPNFLMVFAITLLFYLIYDLLKNYSNIAIVRNIVILGTTVLPSCVILLLQAVILYRADDSSICFIFGTPYLGEGLKNIVSALVAGILFPLWVFVFNYNKMKKHEYFTYVMFGVAFAQGNLLSETGARQMHGNFMWGIFLSAYILFLVSITVFVKNLTEKRERVYYYIVGIALLICHLSSGILYFYKIIQGYHYFI